MSDSKISCPNDDGFCDARFVFSHHTNHTASAKHVTMVLMFLHAIRLSLVRLIHKLKLSPVIINRISMRRLKWIMRRVNYQIVSHMIWIEMKALQWLVTSVDALWFSFAHLKQSMTWANRRYRVKNDDGFCDARFVFSHYTTYTASAKHVTMALMYLHAIRLSLVR